MYLLQEDEGNDDEIMRLLGTSNDATPTPSIGGDFHSTTNNEVDIMISPVYGDSQNEKEQDLREDVLSEEGSDPDDALIAEAAGVISEETLNKTADQIDLVQELESNSSITAISPVCDPGSNVASESEPVDSNSGYPTPCSSTPLPTSQDVRILSLNGISEADTSHTSLVGDTVCHTQLGFSSRPPSKDQSPSHSSCDTSLSGVGANDSVSTVAGLRRKTPSVSWERRALMVNEGTQTLTWRLAGAAIATGGIDHLSLLPLQAMSAHDQAQSPNEEARALQSPASLTTTQSPVLQQDVHKTKPLLSAPTTEVTLQLSTLPTPSPVASSTFSDQTCPSVPVVDSLESCDRIPLSSSLQDITRTIPITELPIPSSSTARPVSLVTPTSTASSALMISRLAPPSTPQSPSPRSSPSTTSGLSATTPSMASTTSSMATPSTPIPAAPARPTQSIVSNANPAFPVFEHSLEALKQRVLLEAQKLDEALGSYQTQQTSELVSAVQSPTHPQPVAMTTTPPVLPLKPSPQIITIIPSHSVATNTAPCNTTTAGHTILHTTTPNSAVHTLSTPLHTTTAAHTIPHTTTPDTVHTLCTPLHTTTTSTATYVLCTSSCDTSTNSTVHTLSTLHYSTTNATASGHQKSDMTNSKNVELTTADVIPSPTNSTLVTPAVSSTSPLPPSELPPLVITSVMSCANDDSGDVVCVNPSQEDSDAVVPEHENMEQHPDQNMDVEMEPVPICEIDTESVRSLQKEDTVEVGLDHVGKDTSDTLKECVNDVETEQDDSPRSVASHQMDIQESSSKDGELSQLSTTTNNLHEARTQEPLELPTAPKSITVCFPVVDWRMKQICGSHMMGLSATPIQLLPTTNGLHPKQGGGGMHTGGEMKEERERKKVRVVHVVTSKLEL